MAPFSASSRRARHAPIRRARSRIPRLLATCPGTALGAASFVSVSPAGADTFPGPVTFAYTGGEQPYTVPADVYLIQIEAVGGNGSPDATHGVGMDLNVGLPVTPGDVLYAEVGAAGGVSTFGGGAPAPQAPAQAAGGATSGRARNRRSAAQAAARRLIRGWWSRAAAGAEGLRPRPSISARRAATPAVAGARRSRRHRSPSPGARSFQETTAVATPRPSSRRGASQARPATAERRRTAMASPRTSVAR
jgi:hypothetical protein